MRVATAEDVFGESPPRSIVTWKPDRNHHGRIHPSPEIDTVYFTIMSDAGSLSGGVDRWLYQRLSAQFGIEYVTPWGDKDADYEAKFSARMALERPLAESAR